MNAQSRLERLLALGLAALLSVACANKMAPAKQAIDRIENAVTLASIDAGKYIPDQLESVQGKLRDLKADFERKDYAAVLARGPAVLTEADGLETAAVAKKEAVTKALSEEWKSLESSIPKRTAELDTHITTVSKSKRHAKGIDLASAKADLASASSLWEKAQTAFKGGNVEEAVNVARDAQAKAEAAAVALGMPSSSAKA